ncbi:MAG: hypothetical protein GIW94_15765 [Candidatus Eremiobacteraeota bacterium]|nr:hypothetical protein [Candidatus Eremiobacteraeota bacterium]MBC5822168.1 hypothetical protein [Candidatus Eremiobacteraeota bacterium]
MASPNAIDLEKTLAATDAERVAAYLGIAPAEVNFGNPLHIEALEAVGRAYLAHAEQLRRPFLEKRST